MTGLRSLRVRVTVLATLATLVMLAGAAFSMFKLQERQLFAAVDASLLDTIFEIESSREDVRFDQLRDRLEQRSRTRPAIVPAAQQISLIKQVSESSLDLQLLDRRGNVMAAGGAFRNVSPLLTDRAVVRVRDQLQDREAFLTVTAKRGNRYRISTTAVGEQVLIAGYSLRDIDRSLRTQRAALIGAVPALAALVGLLIWVVLGQALRPVEAIRREVRAIGPGELGRRVPEPANSVELERLARTMNDMLERLDDSADRQSRFISDAAHELRSPLAGMRGQLEVNLAHPDAPDRREAEESILVETKRMQRLVDDLLLLTRADHNSLALSEQRVDLDDLVLDEASRLRNTSDLTINTGQVSGGQVRGDEAQLRRIIRNLADNAMRHADSAVTFSLAEHGGAGNDGTGNEDIVELVVVDDGAGVPPAEAERIFERFARREDARDRDSGGSGLGLAISREIAHKHGGTLTLDDAPGARFVLRLPAAH